MLFIYDNLTAGLVMVSVALLLTTLQMRSMKKSVTKISRNVAKEQAQSFATWVEDDLEAMGENMDSGSSAPFNVEFETPVDSAGVTTQFTFYRDSVVTVDSTVRVMTQYRLHKTGTKEIDEEEVDLYQVRRREKVGSGSWKSDGGSAGTLGYFEIDMLNRDAQPIANPRTVATADADTVRSTRVRFSVVAPFQNQQTSLRIIHFGSVMLLRDDGAETMTGSGSGS